MTRVSTHSGPCEYPECHVCSPVRPPGKQRHWSTRGHCATAASPRAHGITGGYPAHRTARGFGVGGDFAGFRAGWVLRHGAARGRLLGAQAVVCAAAAEVVRMGLGVPYNKNLWYAPMGEYSR